MQHSRLTVTLEQKDIQQMLKKYHFPVADLDKLQALYEALCPLLDIRAWYLVNPKLSGVALSQYVAAFLTLGEGVDALQKVYLDREHVSEGYMIECIALELLAKSYPVFARSVQQAVGMYAVRMHFLGDRYPFALMREMETRMRAACTEQAGIPAPGVSFNAQYSMTPQKSVALLLELQAAQQPDMPFMDQAHAKRTADAMCHVHLAHMCADCPNTDCEYRQRENYTYGYQRIFGSRAVMAEKGEDMDATGLHG